MNNIKQAFLGGNKLKKITIEEFGIDIYISKWSGNDRAKILPVAMQIEKLSDEEKYEEMFSMMSKVVQSAVKDIDGKRVFDDSEEDFELLYNSDGKVIQDIFEEIMSYNGMTGEAVKEAAKN
jgi:hypothetical protein